MIAVTRAVSPTLAECELTHRPRDPIDVANAIAEHARYEEALRSLGATVVRAPPEPALPDAVFVEDTALALDEVAIMTRPGAPTRRREVESMAQVLSAYKPLLRVESPGTLDGGHRRGTRGRGWRQRALDRQGGGGHLSRALSGDRRAPGPGWRARRSGASQRGLQSGGRGHVLQCGV